MNKKHQQKMYNAYVNVNLRVENVIQIKRGIIINLNVSAKIKKKHPVCGKDDIWNPSR